MQQRKVNTAELQRTSTSMVLKRRTLICPYDTSSGNAFFSAVSPADSLLIADTTFHSSVSVPVRPASTCRRCSSCCAQPPAAPAAAAASAIYPTTVDSCRKQWQWKGCQVISVRYYRAGQQAELCSLQWHHHLMTEAASCSTGAAAEAP